MTDPLPTADAATVGALALGLAGGQARGGAGQPGLATRYFRFGALCAAILAGAAGLGWLPTLRLAGQDGVVAMLAGLAVACAASFLGTVPVALARHRSPLEAMPAQMGAMVVRLVAILALAAAVGIGFGLPLQPFLIWVALGHTVLLVADTLFARSFVAAPARRDAASETS